MRARAKKRAAGHRMIAVDVETYHHSDLPGIPPTPAEPVRYHIDGQGRVFGPIEPGRPDRRVTEQRIANLVLSWYRFRRFEELRRRGEWPREAGRMVKPSAVRRDVLVTAPIERDLVPPPRA